MPVASLLGDRPRWPENVRGDRLMRAVRFRFGAEVRARWRAWLALAALAGLFYGATAAAVAGWQRTDTVVARNLRHKFEPDIFMVPAFSQNGELLEFDAI